MKKNELEFKIDDLNHCKVMFDKKMIGEIYQEVDGFYVFLPTREGGFWAGWTLKAIADRLQELNKTWDDYLNTMLVQSKKKTQTFEQTRREWSGGFRGYKNQVS